VPQKKGREGNRGRVRFERARRDVNNKSLGMPEPTLFECVGDYFNMPVVKIFGLGIQFGETSLDKERKVETLRCLEVVMAYCRSHWSPFLTAVVCLEVGS